MTEWNLKIKRDLPVSQILIEIISVTKQIKRLNAFPSEAQHEMMNLRIFSICVKIRKSRGFSLRKSYAFRKDA